MTNNDEKQSENKINTTENYDPSKYYLTPKTTYWKFVGFEFLVFICISAGTYISTYLGTNFLSSEKKLESTITLYTDFFSTESIGLTIAGIFGIIGFLTMLNMMSTNFELDLKSLFRRLIFSCIDFVYLMISTMLGFSIAALVFAMNQPVDPEITNLKKVLVQLIITLIGLAVIYIPTFMVLPHREKISDLKKKK